MSKSERLTPEQLDETRERLLQDAEDWARWYPHLASSADLAAVLKAAQRDARTLARVQAWTETTEGDYIASLPFQQIAPTPQQQVAALLRAEEE